MPRLTITIDDALMASSFCAVPRAARGPADRMTAQRGARHASLRVISLAVEETTPRRGDRAGVHRHRRA